MSMLAKDMRTKAGLDSRVSNSEVWSTTGPQKAADLLQKRQLKLFQRVLATEEGHSLRVAAFIRGSSRHATDEFITIDVCVYIERQRKRNKLHE